MEIFLRVRDNFIRECVVGLLLYVHGKQLRSCRDSQLSNHTIPGQAKKDRSDYLGHPRTPLSYCSVLVDKFLLF